MGGGGGSWDRSVALAARVGRGCVGGASVLDQVVIYVVRRAKPVWAMGPRSWDSTVLVSVADLSWGRTSRSALA